ncbi:hypothetical protein OU997_05245 [Pseudomonas sp. SL4(2022)]|uniref:hypothetical protein n=1 Tax=Pseudomonas sp. SL4(2022) TaxID=2994661 RepID=UPI0022715FF8|nr:hypothetical protein [Pseudomonas sp. SL4(2022)]WAC45578.1 hypothetical protein OU997_05245 [Pseudomonas sp. SL4(2022)]
MSLMLYTQLFRGPTEIAPWPSRVFEEVFKLQNMTAEPTTAEIGQADPTRVGLPPLDSVTSTSEIILTGEAVNFSPQAAAIAMYGSVTRVPGGSVDDEEVDAYIDRTIMLQYIPLVVASVKSDDDAVTYTRNIDYAITASGLRILPGGPLAAAITAAVAVPGELKHVPIKVTYTYMTYDLIKPFTTGQKFWRVLVGQVNEGGNNERRRIECFYCKITLNGGIPLNQGAEFGVIPIQIKLLPDPNIFDPDEAAMWQWEVQAVAA